MGAELGAYTWQRKEGNTYLQATDVAYDVRVLCAASDEITCLHHCAVPCHPVTVPVHYLVQI